MPQGLCCPEGAGHGPAAQRKADTQATVEDQRRVALAALADLAQNDMQLRGTQAQQAIAERNQALARQIVPAGEIVAPWRLRDSPPLLPAEPDIVLKRRSAA